MLSILFILSKKVVGKNIRPLLLMLAVFQHEMQTVKNIRIGSASVKVQG
jgi:hypothetical protein